MSASPFSAPSARWTDLPNLSDSILLNAIVPALEAMNRLLRGINHTTRHQIIVTTQATETTIGDGKG